MATEPIAAVIVCDHCGARYSEKGKVIRVVHIPWCGKCDPSILAWRQDDPKAYLKARFAEAHERQAALAAVENTDGD